MKRSIRKTSLLALTLLLLVTASTGCLGLRGGVRGGGDNDDGKTAADYAAAIPGSYTVPEGWVLSEDLSREGKVFYVQEGHEDDTPYPDNISVEVGTNRYSADDHMSFRDAILRQIVMQTKGSGAEVGGTGTYTAQEDILYIFTITEPDVVTTQFYVVGDKRYCLIHLTNFSGSEEVDAAARSMADSFVWEE